MAERLQTVVVRRDPRRRRYWQALALMAIVLLVAASFWGGRWQALSQLREARTALLESERRVAELRAERDRFQHRLSNLEVGAEVDRQSVEQLRQTIRSQQRALAQLNEEIAFYKGLMAPTERERGLGIRAWELYPTAEPGRFEYKLTVQQLAVDHSVLQGHVTVEVAGRRSQGGAEEVLSLHELSKQIEMPEIKLRFKYFQNIEGELQLPDGFEPQRIDVVAHSTQPRTARAERHFGWVVQED